MLNVSAKSLQETSSNIYLGDSSLALQFLHSFHDKFNGVSGDSSPHDSRSLSIDSNNTILSITKEEESRALDSVDDDPDLAEHTELD